MKFGLNFLEIVTKIIYEFLKFLQKLFSYKNVFMKVNRKDIYFIWVKLKNRKVELVHQRVKVSLAKYVDVFCHDCTYNIGFIFTDTNPHIFRIPKNQNILNTPSRCVSLNFSIEGLFNLNCLQGNVRNRYYCSNIKTYFPTFTICFLAGVLEFFVSV